jgi:hypothetical protein
MPPSIHVEATPIAPSSALPAPSVPPAPAPPKPAASSAARRTGRELVDALGQVPHDTRLHEKAALKELFDQIRKLADPRAADALVAYIATDPGPHWKTEAAMRLAEVADVRAVPTLAWRMAQDPLRLYTDADDPELRRDDTERVAAARMLADLATLYPDQRGDIRAAAEPAVLAWLQSRPAPHANGMRFLAAAHAVDAIPLLRAWADPADLPQPGGQMMPDAWATVTPALRYLGAMKDPSTWALLERQLRRRPQGFDASMESLMQGGAAILGMSLRGVGVGAADGFAEWGSAKAYPLLTHYIEDPKENEQSRQEACAALAWVATDAQMKDVADRVGRWNKLDPKSALVRGCYLETLARHPDIRAAPMLVNLLLSPTVDSDTHHAAARVLGADMISMPEALRPKFDRLLADPLARDDAALALLLGGTAEDVARALRAYSDAASMADLKRLYQGSLAYWSSRAYDRGDLQRWVKNAVACRSVFVGGEAQEWVAATLSHSMEAIPFDNGPHSLTRVQLRKRLMVDARSMDAATRSGARAMLEMMKEEGILMAMDEWEQGNHAP